ncbi:MAG: SDR family NAD(P)-dependent oxidoreductase [Rhodobacter sp.]|nr:SDR family NAD(P)-dependent oxidoreductase [Rhodobacter sp.]
MRLENRKVIITGAAQGMGGVITRKLADEGAELFLTARTRGPLEDLAKELKGKGVKVDFLEGDCTIEKDVKAVVGAALKFFGGRIDVLVNAAGATGPIETPVWEIEAEDFSDLLRKNIIGPFLPMKHVMPTMIKQRYGKIVNIGGGSGTARLSQSCRLQRLEMGRPRADPLGGAGCGPLQHQRQRDHAGYRRDAADGKAVPGQGRKARLDL